MTEILLETIIFHKWGKVSPEDVREIVTGSWYTMNILWVVPEDIYLLHFKVKNYFPHWRLL